MYYLYKHKKSTSYGPWDDNERFKIMKFVPCPWKLAISDEHLTVKIMIVRLIFWAMTNGRAEIVYVVSDDGDIMHTSYLIPKCYKFDFMGKYDFEIGPCVTKEKYRGNGIYPYVLKAITESYGNGTTEFYMIVSDDNISSIKGIEKAGFERCGMVKKTKIFKRYLKDE